MEEIINKYDCKYVVEIVDPLDPWASYKSLIVEAKKIVRTETETRFFDYYGCLSGCFRNNILLGYHKKE